MQVALIDVIEWQTAVNLRTGHPVAAQGPLVEMCQQVIQTHHYPGDLSLEANHWVTDTALDLVARYDPGLLFLDYASYYFTGIFASQEPCERAAFLQDLLAQVQRFVDSTQYTPVIVGLGDLGPFLGYVTLTDLDGHVIAGGMNPRYAGIYHPSERDLDKLKQRKGIARVVDHATFRAELGGSDAFYARLPDAVIVAQAGYSFRGVGSGGRPISRLAKPQMELPLRTPLPGIQSITDIADAVLTAAATQKVALIAVEGVGIESFPQPFQPITNHLGWHAYVLGDDQYQTLATGQHFVERPYPPGYPYFTLDNESKTYPFSGIIDGPLDHTIGQRYTGRSAAVGNRSILTHTSVGTKVSIECFARALYNHGVMAVLDAEPTE